MGSNLPETGGRSRTSPVRVRGRWPFLLLLLAGEVLALTILFSSDLVVDGFLDHLITSSRILFHVLVIVAAVLFALGQRFRDRLKYEVSHEDASSRPKTYLLAHLAALACFSWLTSLVLEQGTRPWPTSIVLGGAWAGMGVLTLASWLAMGLPPRGWIPLAGSEPGMLAIGIAVGLAAWVVGPLVNELWNPLGGWTLGMVYWLLGLFFPDAVCDPGNLLVGTSRFEIEVAPACSGFEGIGLVVILLAAYLWASRRELKYPRALLLLPLGICVIWMVNAMRITGLIILGTLGQEDIALGGFHSEVGWLAFIAVSLGLIAMGHRWFSVASDHGAEPREESAGRTSAFLMPLMAVIAVAMITRASSSGFDQAYPLRVTVVCACLWIYRRSYPELRWTFSWQAVALGLLAFVVWMALEGTTPADAATDGANVPPLEPGKPPGFWVGCWLVFRVVGTVLTVPLAEELAFRGYLTRRLITPEFDLLPIGTFSWSSFLISSSLFGFMHGRWVAGLLAGMIYALALYRRRELSDAVLAHATTNALIAATVLTTADWSLWD